MSKVCDVTGRWLYMSTGGGERDSVGLKLPRCLKKCVAEMRQEFHTER